MRKSGADGLNGGVQARRMQAGSVQAGSVQAGSVQAGSVQAGRAYALSTTCSPPVLPACSRMCCPGSMVQTAWRRSALQGGVCLHNISPASNDLLRPIAVVEVNVDDGHLLDARGVGELVAVAGWPVGEGSGGRRAAGRLREETVEEVSKEATARGIRGRNDTKRVTKRSRRVRGRDAERAQRA